MARKKATRKRQTTKKTPTPEPPKTYSQRQLEMPLASTSEEFAEQLRMLSLAGTENHKTTAKLFTLWCIHFVGYLTFTEKWFNEVWKYLPEFRWPRTRIKAFVTMLEDPRVQKMQEWEWLMTCPEAMIWLYNPGSELSKADVNRGWTYLRKEWKKGTVPVSRDRISREIRRRTSPPTKFYYEALSDILKLVPIIKKDGPGTSMTDAEIHAEVMRMTSSAYARSRIILTPAGSYQEVRPTSFHD